MTTPEVAIRAKRKLTNRMIAAHDAARLRPHFTDDLVVIVGDGSVITGADHVVAAFAGQFTDPTFITYVRTTESVQVAADGRRAAEQGHWVGSWEGDVAILGTYLAAWFQSRGQWLLQRELYITLEG